MHKYKQESKKQAVQYRYYRVCYKVSEIVI